jgi:hypothetical protein
MHGILGMDAQTTLLVAAGLLFGLWWVARSPKLATGGNVLMRVFCLHCNWQGRVQRAQQKCGKCGGRQLSVLAV